MLREDKVWTDPSPKDIIPQDLIIILLIKPWKLHVFSLEEHLLPIYLCASKS